MIKKRILLIGSNGMLGQRLSEFFSKQAKVELLCASMEDESYMPNLQYVKINITEKIEVKNTVNNFYPDVIINAAAYTNVDKSESERELAWSVNVSAVEYMAQAAKAFESHLIQISSDYIFDGTDGPYIENDKPNPLGYYGRTKLASENVLKTSGINYSIIRTNVLYGIAKFGRPDFVKWVVDSLQKGEQINIVNDQINNPTYTDDLVFTINRMAEFKKYGVFNIGGPEFLSRYDFTSRIADFFRLDKTLINEIITSDLKQSAARPLKSGLITLKAETELGYKPHKLEETFQLMKHELNL
jgi:dTDP-4-dehydrorhamnose reductase